MQGTGNNSLHALICVSESAGEVHGRADPSLVPSSHAHNPCVACSEVLGMVTLSNLTSKMVCGQAKPSDPVTTVSYTQFHKVGTHTITKLCCGGICLAVQSHIDTFHSKISPCMCRYFPAQAWANYLRFWKKTTMPSL